MSIKHIIAIVAINFAICFFKPPVAQIGVIKYNDINIAQYHIVVGCGFQNGDIPNNPFNVVNKELYPIAQRITDESKKRG